MAPNDGVPSFTAYDAVRLGAPGGGWHCPGPLPTEVVNRPSEPNVMPLLSSGIPHSGASKLTPRLLPMGPAMTTPASADSIAAAVGLSWGPAPSGSLRKLRMALIVSCSTSGRKD